VRALSSCTLLGNNGRDLTPIVGITSSHFEREGTRSLFFSRGIFIDLRCPPNTLIKFVFVLEER
jgi:hypothetical protein